MEDWQVYPRGYGHTQYIIIHIAWDTLSGQNHHALVWYFIIQLYV